MLIKTKILQILKEHPGKSAWELADIVDVHPSTTSSILLKLYKSGVLTRNENEGPRKGYGYYLKDNYD
jgi:DNA-binding IclR family transcriptional regulator